MSSMGTRPAKAQASGYFLASAIFHYLGPSLAVLLFAHIAPTGVAWLRIASAAVVFACWRRPWRIWSASPWRDRLVYVALGAVLAVMNTIFYLAIARLSLATVGTIEFLGVIGVAVAGTRTPRNVVALLLAIAGVAALTEYAFATDPLGLVLAFTNAAGFALYIVLGHRIATRPRATGAVSAQPSTRLAGIDRLGLSMLIAAVPTSAWGLAPALPSFGHPRWLAWGIGVGVCSSVIPYVADQLAMAKLGRGSFAFMMALLPASATVIGALVLHQIPTLHDLVGIALVIVGILIHREAPPHPESADRKGTP